MPVKLLLLLENCSCLVLHAFSGVTHLLGHSTRRGIVPRLFMGFIDGVVHCVKDDMQWFFGC